MPVLKNKIAADILDYATENTWFIYDTVVGVRNVANHDWDSG